MSEANEFAAFVMRQDTFGETYTSECGLVMRREYGETPNGNPMNGKWVLRDERGGLVDFDKYRTDLAERNNLRLISA